MLIELAPLVSALLLWAAFPPLGWGALALVGLTPLLAALRRVRTRRGAAALGFSFGLAFYGSLLWWIKMTGYLALTALLFGLSAYAALYAVGLWHARRWPMGSWWAAAVGGWALMEFLRSRAPFSGFPWGLLGYPIGEHTWPRGATQLIGTTGWSVVAVAVSAGLALAASDRQRRFRFLVLAAGAAIGLTVVGGLEPPTADGSPLRVAVIQGSSPCPGEHCPNENETIFESHLALTRSLRPSLYDLVIWAESSAGSTVEPVTHPERAAEIAAEAQRLGAYFLVGASRSEGTDKFRNVNVVFAPSGSIIGEYAKQHPVPFGEHVPLRPLLEPLVPQLDQVPRDMIRGEGPVVFDVLGGKLGSVISFEGAFPRSVSPIVRAGAEVMVVATNEATFGDSPASDQFIAMTRMRAAEFGVDLVHGAITGKSAFIEAGGRIVSESELLTSEVLTGVVRFRTADLTLYARWGDWVQFLAVMAMLATVAMRAATDRRFAEPETPAEVDWSEVAPERV